MNLIQKEALRLIGIELARLTMAADVTASAARTAQARASDARVFYRSAPTGEAESALLKAAIQENEAIQIAHDAYDEVNMALAAREFILGALKSEEHENPRTI